MVKKRRKTFVLANNSGAKNWIFQHPKALWNILQEKKPVSSDASIKTYKSLKLKVWQLFTRINTFLLEAEQFLELAFDRSPEKLQQIPPAASMSQRLTNQKWFWIFRWMKRHLATIPFIRNEDTNVRRETAW